MSTQISNCPNCGGDNLFITTSGTPANGSWGPRMLPKLPMARLNVVVCEACGLTQFFARRIDIENLKASGGWVKVTDRPRPLGIDQA